MKKRMYLVFLTFSIFMLAVGCNKQEKTAGQNIDFPQKDIQIVVPYATGGNSDVTARIFAKIIQEENLLPGANISVVNMVGGNTRTGLNEVLKAKPDGHTLLLHHTAFNTMEAVGQLPMSYRDYEAIGQVSEMAYVYTGKKNGMGSFAEYQQVAKENPGSVTLGIPGVGGTGHMVLEYLLNETNTSQYYKTVPFQGGGGELATAILGGQVDIAAQGASAALKYSKSGDVIPLVVSTQEPLPEFPNTPTFKDFGVEGEGILRTGFFAPPDTPDEIVEIWEDVIKRAFETEEYKEFTESRILTHKFIPGDEWEEILDQDQEMFNKIGEIVEEQMKK
ncbi:tripartite tricarboxylate transporter substrate binding protein [Virgibacillus ndiopensis]|uniref:tripartite tricarboxylate transporter substrate binding protein n=1 Tax=Virgibacillus ndiopensis TaxID=2004408 RepID=UPI000C078182|nr:tripartite tricarboxylate transporter substrate binding protein [Virgibacillus ndiopensis]